jgi:hypothetical protein
MLAMVHLRKSFDHISTNKAESSVDDDYTRALSMCNSISVRLHAIWASVYFRVIIAGWKCQKLPFILPAAIARTFTSPHKKVGEAQVLLIASTVTNKSISGLALTASLIGS